MTIKEYFDLIIKKHDSAYLDLLSKSTMDLIGMPEQLRNEVNKQKDELRGMMDAYQDIANEIAYQEGFEMPAFDCCKGK